MSTSTTNRVPTDPPSSSRVIENLSATYAELVDDGDFGGVGDLLADATFMGGAGSVSGRDAIEKMLRGSLIVYDDGTPRTKHVTTNVAIEVDEEAGTAVSRAYLPRCRRCPTWLCNPSSAVGTKTASSAATGTGASWSGASEPISSAT